MIINTMFLILNGLINLNNDSFYFIFREASLNYDDKCKSLNEKKLLDLFQYFEMRML